jgi:hypothetical protein
MRANFPWLPKGSGTQRQRELILGQSPTRPSRACRTRAVCQNEPGEAIRVIRSLV